MSKENFLQKGSERMEEAKANLYRPQREDEVLAVEKR